MAGLPIMRTMGAHVELLAQWMLMPDLGPLALVWGTWLVLTLGGQIVARRAYMEEPAS
jgi:hypothetical protein